MKKNLLLKEAGIYRGLLTAFSFLIFSTVAVFGQNRQITGRVVANDNDSSIAGVTVKVKGSSMATATDRSGNFSINASPNAVLVFSSVGYATQEVPVKQSTTVTVRLVSDQQSLQQVVVIGYGTAKRKDLTGAISSVTADQIDKVPVTTLDQALQGRAAGVQVVNNDAAPGGNVSVLVRGVGSLASGGNAPLYVIDGYPTLTGINNINPNDIASIDVLKDASATAIYGIRAANGVVIITTKKGAKGKMQVSLDLYEGIQSKPKLYKILNAFQFATLSNEVEAADSTHTYHGLPIWHTPDQLHSVDWQNAMFRTGLTQNYTIGIRGGSDKVQTGMSFGYYNQKGIVLGSFFKRFTLGLNLDYQPVKWLKSSTSVKYGFQDSNNPFGTGQLFNLVINPPTLDDGNKLTNEIKDGKGNYGFYNPVSPNVSKFAANPVYTVETNRYKNNTNFLLATSSLEATLIEGLRVKTNAGVNVTGLTSWFFQPEDSRANQQYPGSIVGTANYHQNTRNVFEWVWENTIAYDRTFGDHTIHFVGGISAQKNTTTLMGASATPVNNNMDIGQMQNVQFDVYGNGQQIYTLASEFARLTYQFADKYIITGTIRRDGSSKFDTANKYGVFPSGSVAWKIKNESFLQNVNWLADLKLRGSYGRVGNEIPIGLFQYQALYAGYYPANYNGGTDPLGNPKDNFGYPFNKIYQNGVAQIQLANPNLKWETDEQTDIGLDAAFLNGALTFTADWFNRNSKDFLLTLQAPAQSGYRFVTRNVGSMNNKGFEFAINYSSNKGKDFHYGIGLTLATIKNTLTSITSGTDFVTNFGGLTLTGQGWDEFSHSRVGGPVGEFFGYKAIGIFQSQAQIDALNAKAPGGIYWRAATKPGDRYYADVNGDGVVNADDRVPIGNPQPKLFGGLSFDATYKNWDFNLYFYGTAGNKILNYVESNLESFQKRGSEGVQNVSVKYFENHWTPDRPSNRYARALANDDNTNNNIPSSVWVENGSYLKLRSVTIGYTLPASLLRSLSMTKLRVYVSSQNLFTITKYSGMDPEIGMQGSTSNPAPNPTQYAVDNGTYPFSRFFTFGLNVTF